MTCVDPEELASIYLTKERFSIEKLLMENKLMNLESVVERIDKRVDNLEMKIDKLLAKQEQMTNYLLYIAIGVGLTLMGVVVGRVVDLSLLHVIL